MRKFVIYTILAVGFATASFGQSHRVETPVLTAEISTRTGAITRLKNTQTGWDALHTQKGLSFEMTLTRPDASKITISGANQQPSCTVYKDSVVFNWSSLRVGNTQERIAAEFTGVVRHDPIEGLLFSGRVANNSDYRIETLSWPIFGNLSIPDERGKLYLSYLTYSALKRVELYPQLEGYYSGNCNLPEHAFATVGDRTQGLYFCSKDPEMREYIQLRYEITPTIVYNQTVGQAGSGRNYADRALLNYRISPTRHLFVIPGGSHRLAELVVRPYTGDWEQAADIYKTWRKSWFKAPHRPEWIEKVNAWQQLQINSSESNINFTVDKLVDYARECKQYGVDAIQLTGWNWGGQDRGLPRHELDPRLGSPEQFRQAIRRCRQMGVRIILFTKFTWAEYTAPWYETYRECIVHNADGDPCAAGGYRYNTYTQLTSFNNRRFGILCFLSDRCRALLREEFKKCLDLGAAGMVYDENQHHAGTQLCYNPAHGHNVADYIYRGDQLLGREFYDMIRRHSPEFIMTGEGPYDLQGQYYATYTRATVDHTPLMRYIDPELPIICAVTDHNDRNRINMCLMNKYIVSYEPRNFKGRLREFPRMMEYGSKMDALRKRYSEALWEATFNSRRGASVSGSDEILYSVLNRKSDGKRAVVVINKSTDAPVTVRIDLPGASEASLFIVTPENPDPRPFNPITELAPQSAMIVIEH